MTIRLAIIFVLSATLTAAFAASASAATPRQIIRDAQDGSIDGTYTAAELRAADAQINPQEREYNDWDFLFANALRRLANPDEPKAKVAVVRDFNGNGTIDASDVKEAAKRTEVLKKKTGAKGDDTPTVEAINDDDNNDDDESDAAAAAGDDGSDDGSGESSAALLALLFLIPAAIIGVGVWRMQRSRRRAALAADGADPDAPTTNFSVGDKNA